MHVTNLPAISTHTPLTGCNSDMIYKAQFIRISTHTPLTGCNDEIMTLEEFKTISTHTPLTGCNQTIDRIHAILADFYSHTPHGVQQSGLRKTAYYCRFLLTHPSRGATESLYNGKSPNQFLLTHPSRGATYRGI